jgi:hypothetical protein
LQKEVLGSGDTLYFALLRQWLLDCDQHSKHYRCVLDNTEPSFLPTRLLCVGGSDPSRLQLRETKSISEADAVTYIALSHRWDDPSDEKKKVYCTTRDNYAERLKGFTRDSLPKTFQDAINLTRALGQNFLWIDALCIIQTVQGADDEDWKHEAGRMEETFGSAYCTIAADSALGWDHGFLPSASALPVTHLPQSARLVCTYNTNHDFDFENDVNNSELNERAWVLQERVLSRRILHFTSINTYFACGLGVRCGYIANQTMLEPSLWLNCRSVDFG